MNTRPDEGDCAGPTGRVQPARRQVATTLKPKKKDREREREREEEREIQKEREIKIERD